ncbi:hypothetical protein [Dethiosulfatarculus sandiegensis]|uniref:hypothetical protein n=1 Tax=Dethiosulfatarculus sandiegensis TaxID=1429043 RepID=UPI0005C85E67|nr:hypothetical protein [Dethiosulfatarculus sandiegensis]
MLDIQNTLNQLKVLIVISMMVLLAQKVGFGFSVVEAIPGILATLAICMVSLILKDLTPKLKFPAFAWATMIALILSMPFMPTAPMFLAWTQKVNFLGTTTPILAFAGISVGNKVDALKKIRWKLVIVAMAVFCGTFFGSAIISEMILRMQGII